MPSTRVNDTFEEAIKFPSSQMYADPSRKLYHTLGMDIETLAKTPSKETKRSYVSMGALSNIAMSLWVSSTETDSIFLNQPNVVQRGPVQHPSLIGKNGNISQLGGEFIFGPGNVCSFASRMRHTEDRTYHPIIASQSVFDML